MRNLELKQFVYNNVYQNSSNGYVLTPSELASEMVSTLPESVFDSDKTTFLDPICKSGTFLFEIVEKLYQKGHSIQNISSRIFTVDSNFHSLNVAQSTIGKILNKESGSFKIDYKYEWVEKYYNRLIYTISERKFSTLEDFLDIIIMDKGDFVIMNEVKINISKFIEQYEKVSKLESKLFGEVFTPRKLIDEMLDTLPLEIWKKKDLKWLDPAVGIGNFPTAIVDRLMIGLEEEFPDESNRRKWILEEMLFMCDISTKNLFLLYMLFDKNNEYKLNVYRGSFLTEDFDKHMKNIWKLDGFDVIVGNPPYNENGGVGGGQGGASGLWKKFIYKSIDISKNLIFITPNLWLGNKKDFSKIKELVNINFINLNECNKHFNVGAKLSYYLFSKEIIQDCILVTNNSRDIIDINSYDYIPLSSDFDFLKSKSILDKLFTNGTFKFYSGDNRSINTHLYKDGGEYISFYSSDSSRKNLRCSEPIKGSNILKVISAYINDFDGENVNHFTEINIDKGVGKQCGYFEVNSYYEGENLIKFLKSDIVKFINNNFRKGRYANSVLERIPIIELSSNIEDYFSLFDITSEQIEFIKSCVKKITKG